MEIERKRLRCVEAVRCADPVGRREELRGAVPFGRGVVCLGARATYRPSFSRARKRRADVDLPKINAELFAKIRTDKDGPEFDDAEPVWWSAALSGAQWPMSSAKASITG